MKKLTSLFVILALLMLCACGSKTGATADGAAAPKMGFQEALHSVLEQRKQQRRP